MKKIDITGWKYVFSFTFVQTIKAKSYIITIVILCVLAAVSLPVYGMIKYGGNEVSENGTEGESADGRVHMNNLEKLYISYDKNASVVDGLLKEWETRYDCKVEYLLPDKVEAVSSSFNDSESKECILKITKENGVYSLETVTGWDTMKIQSDVDRICDDIAEELQNEQMSSVISADNMPTAEKKVTAYVDGKDSEADTGLMGKYFLWLGSITFLTFIVTFAGQGVATSIVTEKSSKLVEYLLITIKPMAIVVGKVTAMLLSLLIQVCAVMMSFGVSLLLSNNIVNVDVMGIAKGMLESGLGENVVAGFDPISTVIAILIILVGLLFFTLTASIAGAAVSKLEEVAEGTVMFTILVIVGAYMSLALAMGNVFTETGQLEGGFAMACCLLPISSVFTVPVNLVMGTIPMWIGIAALLILVVCAVAVLLIASKIYEYLLFYNGVTLGPKDIIHIVRHGRVKEAEK